VELLGGIFLIIIGVIMLIKPKTIWKVADSWKTKTKAEPGKLYIMLIRIAGFILGIGGILAIFEMK
jgi:uncharacterized membrane protein YfcA